MNKEEKEEAWRKHEIEQLRYWRDIPFKKKLEWLEEAHILAEKLHGKARTSEPNP